MRLLNKTTTTTSSDGKTITITRDSNGDGKTDQVEVDIIVSASTKTIEITDKNLDGTTKHHQLTSTSNASGNSTTSVASDINGDTVYDLTRTDALVYNLTPAPAWFPGARRRRENRRGGGRGKYILVLRAGGVDESREAISSG